MSRTHTNLARPALFPLTLVLLLASTGCAALSRASGPEEGAKDSADDDAAVELADLEHQVEVARLELELARLEAEQELANAGRELDSARLELEKDRIEREAFAALGRAAELDETRLGLDHAKGRAEDAAAELAELESMYAAEEFATKTKELVITRSRRDLELAQRSLVLAQQKLQALETYELPGKEKALELSRRSAEKGVVEAEQALAKTKIEQRIAVARAEQELAELERKAEKARKKVGAGNDESGREAP